MSRYRMHLLSVLAFVAPTLRGAGTHAQSGEVFDPPGDVSRKGEAYLDVIDAELGIEGQTYVARMQVVAPLPEIPPAASGRDGWTVWELAGVDLDPSLALPGWPFAKNQDLDIELAVLLVSDGHEYFALFVDRRPLANGRDPILVDSRSSDRIELTIADDIIEIDTDAALWARPALPFSWRPGTLELNSIGSQSLTVFDFGTDPPGTLVAWPE